MLVTLNALRPFLQVPLLPSFLPSFLCSFSFLHIHTQAVNQGEGVDALSVQAHTLTSLINQLNQYMTDLLSTSADRYAAAQRVINEQGVCFGGM